MKLRSYPKVWNLGHPNIESLFDGPVVIQEKIDGSQFSFGIVEGELFMRSKGAEVFAETADKLFRPAVNTARRLYELEHLVEGWIYRGETLCKPKHNTLQYERVPKGNIILFDVDVGLEKRMHPGELAHYAEELGIESVPYLYEGGCIEIDTLREMLKEESCLGGTKVEGVVIKNYNQFGRDGKMLMGKHVSEEFKEKHGTEWKKSNPSKSDVIALLIEKYRHENRWKKAVQHLREKGELENSPRDIGGLIKEVQIDILEEEAEEIKEALFKAFIRDIQRGSTKGLPEWYKEQLLESQFKE